MKYFVHGTVSLDLVATYKTKLISNARVDRWEVAKTKETACSITSTFLTSCTGPSTKNRLYSQYQSDLAFEKGISP